jgi:hypothetical protein
MRADARACRFCSLGTRDRMDRAGRMEGAGRQEKYRT